MRSVAIMLTYGEKPIYICKSSNEVEIVVERMTGNLEIGMACAAWADFAPVGERLILSKFELEVRDE